MPAFIRLQFSTTNAPARYIVDIGAGAGLSALTAARVVAPPGIAHLGPNRGSSSHQPRLPPLSRVAEVHVVALSKSPDPPPRWVVHCTNRFDRPFDQCANTRRAANPKDGLLQQSRWSAAPFSLSSVTAQPDCS